MQSKLLIAVLCILFPVALYAQTGKVSGRVTDRESGEPLIGANVIIEGTQRGASTNVNGEFVILSVPIGKVTLTCRYVGYKEQSIRDILVKSNETNMIDIQLSSDAVKLEVKEIVAERPLVDKNVTNSKSTQTAEDIENLPVRGVESIVALQAGIVQQGGTLYVRGSRADAVGYMVDGAMVNNPLVGGRSLTVIQNAIAEVNFQAGGYSAEFGGANAGLISTTTRTGGRKLQVGFEAYTDNWSMTDIGKETFLGTYTFGVNLYSLTVGGPVPLTNDKLRFFVAAQNSFTRTPLTNSKEIDLTTKYDALLRQTPAHALLSAEEQAKTGIFDPQQGERAQKVDVRFPAKVYYNAASEAWAFNGNLTYDFNPVINASLRVGGSYAYGRSHDGAGLTTWRNAQRAGLNESEDFSANLKWTHLISSNTFYEVLVNYFSNFGVGMDPDHQHDLFAYGDSIANAQYGYMWRGDGFPMTVTSMFGSSFVPFGYPMSSYGKTSFNSMQGKFNFVHQIGRTHEIKVGGEATQYQIRSYGIGSDELMSLYSFRRSNPDASDLQIAMNSRIDFYGYDQWGNKIDDGINGPKEPVFAAFYALDKIELEDLVINIGLRYDYINTASKMFKNPNNVTFDANGLIEEKNYVDAPVSETVSPRLGFSFPVTDQTVFYAQYGHFVQQSRLRDVYLGSAVTASNIKGGYAIQTPVGFGLRPERTVQYDFGFRQQIGDYMAFDIGAFYKDIKDQIQQRQVSAAYGASHGAYYAWVNGDFATTSGLSLKIDLRRVERIQASLDYTYSDARGTGSNPSSSFYALWQSPTETPFLPKYVSPLAFDQTHRGSLNIDYRFSRDDGPELFGAKILERMGLNMLFQFNSGHPYTRVDENSFGNRRQPIEPINASRTPWNFQLDARIDKSVTLFGMLEANFYIRVVNLLDIQNITDVFMTSGSATDNGYLATEDGQKLIANYATYGEVFAQLYKDFYYQTRIMNAGVYGAPRQIYVGMRLDF